MTISRRALVLAGIAASPAARAVGEALASPVTPPDPLIGAIDRFRAGCRDYERIAPVDDDECDSCCAATYGPPLEVLQAWDRPAHSRDSAIAALRLAAEQNRDFSASAIATNMVAAALAYFEAEA